MPLIAAASYLVGALCFLVLTLLLVLRWHGRLHGRALTLACVMSAIWCGVQALQITSASTVPPVLLYVLEIARGGAWLNLLLQLLGGSEGARLPRRVKVLVHSIWLVALAFAVVPEQIGHALPGAAQIIGPFLVALTGLVLVEQLYRNTAPERRWSVKHLCLGLGGMFAYDLYLYADGLLFRQLDLELWSARGAINALIVPLLGLAASRNPRWSLDLSLSRRLAFYTTGLAAVGVYLLAMAAGGYYLRYYGGSWGAIAQIVFLFAALLILLVALFSGQVRARWKVLLSKHFYRYKYDYREEWLRLIQMLFTASDEVLPERALNAVADLVESPLAGLWLDRSGVYVPAGGDFAGPDSAPVPCEAPLVRYLASEQWIIDVPEFRAGHPRYRDLELPSWLVAETRAWLVLPLLVEQRLLGFMLLARPRVPRTLDWEDFALLKTVGRQVAGVLARHEAAQALAETRQFEAYNRLTAFIMHDLKNLIAQQSLVVKNAARHKDNPAFIEDAIRTVDNSVQRMSRLLEQLRRGDAGSSARRTRLRGVVDEVLATSAQRRPVPTLDAPTTEPLEVVVQPERLALVLSHVVTNAQDATPATGWVRIGLRRESDRAVIEVSDNGSGMDEQFVRERLFRPFDTTKGSKGMGIGAYQTREFVRACGGDVQVHSQPGAGTRFVIRLPLAGASANIADEPQPEIKARGALR